MFLRAAMVLHPDAKAFVARILADPSDAVIRAVFADWLHEHGGVGNENWARYIRLRAQAAEAFGIDRELLQEEADQLAPHLTARLTAPAEKLATQFHHLIDLLPPDRIIVSLGNFRFPVEPNAALGETNARAARSLVLVEKQGVFAVVTDMQLPGLARVLGQRLAGRIVLFPTYSNEMTAALDRTFPSPIPTLTESQLAELNHRLAQHTVDRLLAEARQESATQMEIVAQPSGFEVRVVIGGRSKRKEVLSNAMGELVVKAFLATDSYSRLRVRARPRNTSFGVGVEVEV